MRQHGGFDDRQHRVAGVAARRHQRRQRGRVGLRRVLQRQRQIEQLFEAEHAGGVDQIVRLNARGGDVGLEAAGELLLEHQQRMLPLDIYMDNYGQWENKVFELYMPKFSSLQEKEIGNQIEFYQYNNSDVDCYVDDLKIEFIEFKKLDRLLDIDWER